MKKVTMTEVLLACGILSSLLYASMLVFVPMAWKAYSSTSYTVSELSAIGAPTRPIWVPLGIIYTLLVTSFGCGVWQSSRNNHPQRVVAGLLIVYGVIGLGWPPMHQREVLAMGGGTLTDTMHIVFTIITVILMVLAIGFGAFTFGKSFRFYSISTILLLLLFGGITGSEAPAVQANMPTPWIGVMERINIGVFLTWVATLSFMFMRKGNGQN